MMKKILIFFTMLFLLVSCGKPGSQKAFEGYIKDLKSADQATMKSFLENDSENPAVDKFMDFYVDFFKKVDYKVLSVKENGDESILEVEMKAPNILEPFADIFTEGIGMAFSGASEEDMEKFFYDSINNILTSKDLEYISGTIPVYMRKKDGDWVISRESNSEFFLYLTGGLSGFGTE
jgi:hypothetical protein